MKVKEKELAIILRKEGYSVNEISKKLNVSKASVSLWTGKLKFTKEEQLKLDLMIRAGNRARVNSNLKLWRNKRKTHQEEGVILAKKHESNTLFIAGCMLYWAEGQKGKSNPGISNSDVNVIKTFQKFLLEYFPITKEQLIITINFYTDVLSEEEIIKFWLDELGLNNSNLRKCTKNTYSKYSKKLRKNKLKYGTCYLSFSGERARILHNIYGAIQYLGGFTNEDWLFYKD